MRAIASSGPSNRGVGAGDDDEVLVAFVARAAGEFDLVDEFLARDRVGDVFVIMRALGVELILDVDAGDAGADELAHRAHGVQRLAEARPAVGHHRDRDRVSHVAGDAHLLVHGQQRLRRAARAAGDETAVVDRREAGVRNQPPSERVIGDRHVDEALFVEEPAQRLGCFHGFVPPWRFAFDGRLMAPYAAG